MIEAGSVLLAQQLSGLGENIELHNRPLDIEGLFSQYILKRSEGLKVEWAVACTAEWLERDFDNRNVYHLAILGYSLELRPLSAAARTHFVDGLDLLRGRDPFRGSHIAYAFQPMTLLGIALGITNIENADWSREAGAWLMGIIDQRVEEDLSDFYLKMVYDYVEFIISGKTILVGEVEDAWSLEESALVHYLLSESAIDRNARSWNGRLLSKIVLEKLLSSPLDTIRSEAASLVWIAVNRSLKLEAKRLLASSGSVSRILSRFESAMKRWRFDEESDSAVRWPINHEREVQDIVWLLLRPNFDDLKDEETLPKFGHSSYKPDFAIPSLRLLVEVKMAYRRSDLKKIEKEIMEDCIGYLAETDAYARILVFVYDKSSSVQEHSTTVQALKKLEAIENVIIVSKPSQLP